jgi:hypothetical protein
LADADEPAAIFTVKYDVTDYYGIRPRTMDAILKVHCRSAQTQNIKVIDMVINHSMLSSLVLDAER